MITIFLCRLWIIPDVSNFFDFTVDICYYIYYFWILILIVGSLHSTVNPFKYSSNIQVLKRITMFNTIESDRNHVLPTSRYFAQYVFYSYLLWVHYSLCYVYTCIGVYWVYMFLGGRLSGAQVERHMMIIVMSNISLITVYRYNTKQMDIPSKPVWACLSKIWPCRIYSIFLVLTWSNWF